MSLDYFELFEEDKEPKKDKKEQKDEKPERKPPASKEDINTDEENPENKEELIDDKESMSRAVKTAMENYFQAINDRMEKIRQYVNTKTTNIVDKKNLKKEIEKLSRDVVAKKAEFERLFYDEDFEFFDNDTINV